MHELAMPYHQEDKTGTHKHPGRISFIDLGNGIHGGRENKKKKREKEEGKKTPSLIGRPRSLNIILGHLLIFYYSIYVPFSYHLHCLL